MTSLCCLGRATVACERSDNPGAIDVGVLVQLDLFVLVCQLCRILVIDSSLPHLVSPCGLSPAAVPRPSPDC